MKTKLSTVHKGNFGLKEEHVALLGTGTTVRAAEMSVADLERMRTTQTAVSASKFGLEAICGASCETGAQ
ncbi:MAG: hypothetical protein NXI16_04105 [Alphaproteobacteria bacterium]|nr:hypothetical protein [Alphaproteobacteria bacterium]